MCWSKTQKYNMKNNFSISEQINALRNIDANIPKNEFILLFHNNIQKSTLN